MRTLLGMGVVLALALGATAADEKIDGKKLVGKWEPKEAKKAESMTMEFTKDGKLMVVGEQGGKELKFDGTYKLDGNKLTFELKFGGEAVKQTVTITKLTDDELEGKSEDGKTEAFKKVKPKDKDKKDKK